MVKIMMKRALMRSRHLMLSRDRESLLLIQGAEIYAPKLYSSHKIVSKMFA